MAENHELKSSGHAVSEVPRHFENNDKDDQVLTQLGKRPVLKRNFGFLSMLGFSCTVMITWEGTLFVLAIGLQNGGLAGSVYGYIVVWLGVVTSFSTMAELASMAPTAAGQYHWVSILAPNSYRIALSYAIGWLTMIGWQAIVASGGFLCAQLIQGLAVLNDSSYMPQAWQAVLIYWASITFSILVNTVIARLLPKVEGFILVLHILGFIAIMVPLIYFAPHGSASDVFTSFPMGEAGQQTEYRSCLLGPDGVVHMSEEIQNPAQNVSRAMVFGVLLNGALGFGMLLAALFCLGDLDNVLMTPTGYPFMAIFQQAVRDKKGALTMAALVVIMNIAATMSFVATASRMTWSFARDRGMPGWKLFKKVEPRTTLPIWSIALTCLIAVLLSLIILGSAVAFNDVVSLSISGLYSSYFIGNALLLWRRVTGQIEPYSPSLNALTNTPGSGRLTWGPWKIPEPLGTIVNAIGCAYLLIVVFFSFWPTTSSPTAATMNYAILVEGAVVIVAMVYYVIYARKSFSGPIIEVVPSMQSREDKSVHQEA